MKHWDSARSITSPAYQPSGVQGPHGRVGASRTRTTLTTLADGASPTQDVWVGRVVKHTIAGRGYGDCPIDCPIDCVIAAFDCPIDWIPTGSFGGRRERHVPNTRHRAPKTVHGVLYTPTPRGRRRQSGRRRKRVKEEEEEETEKEEEEEEE